MIDTIETPYVNRRPDGESCLLTETQSAEHDASGYRPTTNVVQSYVKGERTDYGYSSVQSLSSRATVADAANSAEVIDLGTVVSAAEQRRFSAPHNEWDATR